MCKPRVAVDVGGTFYRHLHLGREHRPHPDRKDVVDPDPIEGIMNGVREASIDLSKVALSRMGPTVATNA